MKRLKKLGSVLLALAVMFVMTSTAFADGETTPTYTITLTGTATGHTYDVYQIFTGDVSGEGPNYVLSNISYGKNYVPSNKNVGDLVPKTDIEAITNADSFAQGVVLTNTEPFTHVESKVNNTEISGLPGGYYLIKDRSTVTGNDSSTKFILQVAGNKSVQIKSGVPSVEKKIVSGDARLDVADYSIGDKVTFEIKGTLPSNYADYSSYKYVFEDTLSKGLTYNSDAEVYVLNGGTLTKIESGFSVNLSDSTLTISCDNLKDSALPNTITKDSYIVVKYTATLNSQANIGNAGNENKVVLHFSNNPNAGGSGQTGTTPEDKVVVFTYELDVTKVDGADEKIKLKDAEFKLRSGEKWAIVNDNNKITGWADTETGGTTLKSGSDGVFKVIGLDAGTYYLKETKAPEGYNLIDSEVKIEIIPVYNSNQYGNYTGNPQNVLENLQIKVNDGTPADGVISTGVVSTTVKNNAGTVLPSTGGIGTTLFYVIGGVLVLAAIVLLVTRRRMREE